MKNTKKAFTLVELIVVITILAVLATVAFISFSGQTQDAKNSKVASDLTNLSRAIEISGKGVKTILGTEVAINTVADTTNTANGDVITSGSGWNYGVGNIDFTVIGQNGEEFKDANATPREYLYAYFASGSFVKYQVAGEITDAAGDNLTLIKGSYFSTNWTNDVAGLVSLSTSTDDGVTNNQNIGQTSIY